MGHGIATRIAKLVGALQVASSNDFSMSNLSLRLRTPFLFSLPRSQNLADAVKSDYDTKKSNLEACWFFCGSLTMRQHVQHSVRTVSRPSDPHYRLHWMLMRLDVKYRNY